MMNIAQKILRLQGPILVLGGSGFIGANLLRSLITERKDVYGTSSSFDAWRLEDIPEKHKIVIDLLVDTDVEKLFSDLAPKTIFNCVSYGGYFFETEADLIYQTNFNLTSRLLHIMEQNSISCYIHSGSSSEYGDNCTAPSETASLTPNSDYAVSKVSSSTLISYFGRKKKLPCANLRLYSVYGPLEDSSRLIPNVIRKGMEGDYPDFVNPEISRDFIFVDDVVDAFVLAALNLKEEDYGESFNIGSGSKTTIAEIAEMARVHFGIAHEPHFSSMPDRIWDVREWYANPEKAKKRLEWNPRTELLEGFEKTVAWYSSLPDPEKYRISSKQFSIDTTHSVTAVIACYKDNQAIPIMYRRLVDTFSKLKIDYEIIFVNDNSPDNTDDVIKVISRHDKRVIGISHSRNFGSQAAFRSGMEIATKNSCVLLDGDLQDPPELIEQFVEKWREGYEIIYGRRIEREAPLFMRAAYKLFYRVFDAFSYISIPYDAGDFSLIDKKVVNCILQFPERDLFLRGVRAFVGFRQTGIDYVRPKRMFGVTTNSLLKNIGWAKKGILSFSNTPLNILSFAGTILFIISILLGSAQIAIRFLFPGLAPHGVTTMLLVILFFGSVNLLAVGIVGEYVAKIFEEVKQRPLFIRKSVIRNGEIRNFSVDHHDK